MEIADSDDALSCGWMDILCLDMRETIVSDLDWFSIRQFRRVSRADYDLASSVMNRKPERYRIPLAHWWEHARYTNLTMAACAGHIDYLTRQFEAKAHMSYYQRWDVEEWVATCIINIASFGSIEVMEWMFETLATIKRISEMGRHVIIREVFCVFASDHRIQHIVHFCQALGDTSFWRGQTYDGTVTADLDYYMDLILEPCTIREAYWIPVVRAIMTYTTGWMRASNPLSQIVVNSGNLDLLTLLFTCRQQHYYHYHRHLHRQGPPYFPSIEHETDMAYAIIARHANFRPILQNLIDRGLITANWDTWEQMED